MILFRLNHILCCIYRYGDNARLTVTNLVTSFSRTYEGPQRIFNDLEMTFNVNSSVFFGGLPSNEKVRVLVVVGGKLFKATV